MFLLALGLVLTVAWLWVGWYYVTVYFGQENIFYLLPAELGLFLLGFFAPLGLLWLMVAQSSIRRRLIRLERQVTALASGPDDFFPAEMPPGESEAFEGNASEDARREPSFDVAAEEAAVQEALTVETDRGGAAETPKAAAAGVPQDKSKDKPQDGKASGD